MPALVFILGREPHISVAEIAAVLPDADWAHAEVSAEALIVESRDLCKTPSASFRASRASREISQRCDRGLSTPLRSARDDEFCRGPSRAWELEHGIPARTLVERLGGTIKIGAVWRTIETRTSTSNSEDRIGASSSGFSSSLAVDAIGERILAHTNADRKTHFGYSVYDCGGGRKRTDDVRRTLVRSAAAQKAWLEERGRKVRWVTSREPTLSSVVVQKNDLLPERNGVEVLALVGAERIVLAQTLAVQPFEEWGARDYGRPSRDAKSGMLPPKLARVMVNLGISNLKPQISKHALLDPFCGSGTILTEAMALGVPRIIGTDASAAAVRAAEENVRWSQQRYPLSEPEGSIEGRPSMGSGRIPSVHITECDVRQLSQCVRERVDAIVTEPCLGPPKPQADSRKLQAELRLLYIDAFREFAKVLKPDGRVVFVVPVFRGRLDTRAVDITRDVERMGFRALSPFPKSLEHHPLLRGIHALEYARPDQRVGRRILVFRRSRS